MTDVQLHRHARVFNLKRRRSTLKENKKKRLAYGIMSTRLNFQAENAISERFQRRQTAAEQRTKAAVTLRVANRTFRMTEEQHLCEIDRT